MLLPVAALGPAIEVAAALAESLETWERGALREVAEERLPTLKAPVFMLAVVRHLASSLSLALKLLYPPS